MGPTDRYRQDLTREGFLYDSAQENAVRHLQRLFDELVNAEDKLDEDVIGSESGWISGNRLFKRVSSFMSRPVSQPLAEPTIKGLYFWGGVGRGKTYLMDCFYECLPFPKKLRTHFHRFMQRVHADLTRLKGQKNPLKVVAQHIAAESRVVCFDEFFVSDITDAMILAGLFEELFKHGVVLVATSNIVPDELYKDGLQRARFLPAIALLNQHTEVVNIDGGTDYRLRALERAELYHYPLDEGADQSLKSSFDSLAPEPGKKNQQIEVNGRLLLSRYCADDVIWFNFDVLCDGPRSQNDYIELARIYHAVLLGNVPQMGGDTDDQARRFINLIDEFYDRHVKLVISAAVPLAELYVGGNLSFEFARTTSRLLEMQSHEYLARGHRP